MQLTDLGGFRRCTNLGINYARHGAPWAGVAAPLNQCNFADSTSLFEGMLSVEVRRAEGT